MKYDDRLFSDDDIEYLRDELEKGLKDKFDEVKVFNFIENIEVHCNRMKCLMELPTPSQESADLKYIAKVFKKCLGQLEDLPKKHSYFWNVRLSRNFYEVDFGPDLSYEDKKKLVRDEKAENKKRKDLLNQAKSSLTAISEIIEHEITKESKIGRPKADESNFAYAIGILLFFELSVRPTKTRAGLFSNVLSIAWKALGQEMEYPLKQIKYAVDKLNSVFPP